MKEECEHDLEALVQPIAEIDVSLLHGSGYYCPPIFKCIKCNKIFKTDHNEWNLIEIPIKTIEEIEKETDKNKCYKREKSVWIFILLISISVAVGILLIMLS